MTPAKKEGRATVIREPLGSLTKCCATTYSKPARTLQAIEARNRLELNVWRQQEYQRAMNTLLLLYGGQPEDHYHLLPEGIFGEEAT